MEQPIFRTPVENRRSAGRISHATSIVSLGSCFADNVGLRLEQRGFRIAVNPMGALYNPVSVGNMVERALDGRPFAQSDLTLVDDTWHCLALESKYQSSDSTELIERINRVFLPFSRAVQEADVLLATFGTSWVFKWNSSGVTVGNCHKLDSRSFTRSRLEIREIVDLWLPLAQRKKTIFTVSPIRHLADGLHGNQLSKATLLLAIESICSQVPAAEYFPAYEALMDDLRDYRFYERDMKHPSPVAADYIYSLFEERYFDTDTVSRCREEYARWLRSQHRTILK